MVDGRWLRRLQCGAGYLHPRGDGSMSIPKADHRRELWIPTRPLRKLDEVGGNERTRALAQLELPPKLRTLPKRIIPAFCVRAPDRDVGERGARGTHDGANGIVGWSRTNGDSDEIR